MTLQQKFQTYLEGKGWKVVQSRTSKYITMQKSEGGKMVFLGARGAIRYGKNASTSVAVLPSTYATIKAAANG